MLTLFMQYNDRKVYTTKGDYAFLLEAFKRRQNDVLYACIYDAKNSSVFNYVSSNAMITP